MVDINKELAWSYVKEIREICKPLFDTLKINYFDYSRFYPDNTAFGLFTDPEYVSFFRNHDCYKSGPKHILLPGKHLWVSYIDHQFLSEAREYFNHDHGLTILTQYPEYHEVCNFSTSTENKQILELYLNNGDFIQRFIGYFKAKAELIIKKCSNQRVLITPQSNSKRNERDLIDKVIADLSLNKDFYAELYGELVTLSRREAECISGILQGKTSKVIANELTISNRTVDTHLENAKEKLDCGSKIDLIRKINSQEIIFNWEYK